ncbi:hypothetical protein CN192_15685 [Sinorhizobium medicae]|nr:YdaS family helix-turn-helix protein [Sinorhizobium medicae]RVI55187.1 hypothetical protein CN192_15685 [Sinorhizobium medicae]
MNASKENLSTDPRAIACEAAKTRAGGAKFLARRLGVSRQLVHAWKIVPAKHVLRVEKETGISCHILRPDVFGPALATKETAE